MLVGVDGCLAGWLCVASEGRGRSLQASIQPSIDSVIQTFPSAVCVAVDIPIGLPDSGPRACDSEARRLIKPRGSSVFPAPLRGVLDSTSYEDANERHRQLSGKGFTKQAFGILPKIAEVDALLQRSPALKAIVCEVHPELSFRVWAGCPLQYPKKDPEGAIERRKLIDAEWPGAVKQLREQLPRGGYALDDLHDAFAALWTAQRIVAGTAIQVPATIECDATGLQMQMMA